jgi:hypothetical protein
MAAGIRCRCSGSGDAGTKNSEKSDWASFRWLRLGGRLPRVLNLRHFILRTEGSNQ